MAASEEELASKAHYDPAWIANNGGWLHSNNVLFYFTGSPFYVFQSGNQELISQWQGHPRENEFLGTRGRMEANLRKQRGLQFVVIHDPLESRTMVDGPNGLEPSNLWIIRKQLREQPNVDEVKVLAYYYIINDVIYQAPSVGNILEYRTLNTVASLTKIFATSTEPFFSVAHGHTYNKPVPKSTGQLVGAFTTTSQQSKEPTPMPGVTDLVTEKATAAPNSTQDPSNKSTRTLYDALQMTLQYGKEYMDDVPLVGEPGNFRLAKSREQASNSNTTGNLTTEALKVSTATSSRAQSTAPIVSSGTASVKPLKTIDKNSTTQTAGDGTGNLKRRKSKIIELSP